MLMYHPARVLQVAGGKQKWGTSICNLLTELSLTVTAPWTNIELSSGYHEIMWVCEKGRSVEGSGDKSHRADNGRNSNPLKSCIFTMTSSLHTIHTLSLWESKRQQQRGDCNDAVTLTALLYSPLLDFSILLIWFLFSWREFRERDAEPLIRCFGLDICLGLWTSISIVLSLLFVQLHSDLRLFFESSAPIDQ